MSFQTIDPSTGKPLERYDPMVDRRLERAARAHAAFADIDMPGRADLLRGLASQLRERTDEWAELMAAEMGKPLAEGRSEAEKCAWVCDYYADHGETQLADRVVKTDASRSWVSFRPLGTVLGIMPWNFPFWQVFRYAAPSVMAGNSVLLKHAENTTGCGLAIEEIFSAAGCPDGIFQTLVVEVDRVEGIIDDPRVHAVTLTGSTRAGKAVAAQAGARIKKTVLELGGSDAYVVLEDADIEEAARLCVTSRMINSGQSCIAAKRFIVVDEVRETFTEQVVARMGEAVMGDPREETTTLGPLAREDLRGALHRQVAESVESGARLLMGGTIPNGAGWFYPATVLSDVGPGMPAYDEELFGPVASIIGVAGEAEAIRVANDTRYGLGAAVFTADTERGQRIAVEELKAGACFVNGFVKSDPRLPFGGIKESGYGRELAEFGIREFVNTKTIWVG